MRTSPEFYPYSKPKLNPIEWLLCTLFPMEPLGYFHPKNDLPDILGYQYRLSRTVGEEVTNYVVQARVCRIIEGEYVDTHPKTAIHYTERERPRVALYSIPPVVVYSAPAPEPTAEQISVEELEKCVGSSSAVTSTESPSGGVAPRSWQTGVRSLLTIMKSLVSRPTSTNEVNGSEPETEPSLPVV